MLFEPCPEIVGYELGNTSQRTQAASDPGETKGKHDNR